MGREELGLGRIASVDFRDERYPMRALLPRAASTRSARTWDLPYDALDQGGTGTCTAHAATHALMCAPYRHKASRLGFTPMQLYREGVLHDGWPQNDAEATASSDDQLQFGSDGRAMAKALEARGWLKEYRWGWTVEDVTEWLLERGPVMIGTNWYDSMFNVDHEGRIKIGATSPIAGGHETVLRRYEKRRGLYLLRNSWGRKFNGTGLGLPGFKCRIGEGILDGETLHRLLRENGDALSFIEKDPTPATSPAT